MKVKGAEEEQATVAGNLYTLKQMQEDKWVSYDWIDAEVGPLFSIPGAGIYSFTTL